MDAQVLANSVPQISGNTSRVFLKITEKEATIESGANSIEERVIDYEIDVARVDVPDNKTAEAIQKLRSINKLQQHFDGLKTLKQNLQVEQ